MSSWVSGDSRRLDFVDGQVLGAVPPDVLAKVAPLRAGIHNRGEVIAGELTVFAGKIGQAVGEQNLHLADVSGVEQQLTVVGARQRVFSREVHAAVAKGHPERLAAPTRLENSTAKRQHRLNRCASLGCLLQLEASKKLSCPNRQAQHHPPRDINISNVDERARFSPGASPPLKSVSTQVGSGGRFRQRFPTARRPDWTGSRFPRSDKLRCRPGEEIAPGGAGSRCLPGYRWR